MLLDVHQMNKINGPIPAIDLQYHQLARLAANNYETASNSFIDLNDACDVILPTLKIDLAECLVPISARSVNAGQILINDPLAATLSLPHRDVAVGMPSENEVIDFEDAVHRVILLKIRDVPVGEGVLHRFKKGNGLLT